MLKAYSPNLKDIVVIVLLFPAFFIFMYLDTINTPLSPDLFWKLPAILVVLVYMFVTDRRFRFPAYFIFGALLAVKQLLVLAPKGSYYIKAASMGSLDLIVPVLTLFLVRYVSYKKIGKYIFFLSSWIIISTIPYHLGLLKNKIADADVDYNLAKYGAAGRLFTGPFLNIHDAAITLSFALAGVLYYFTNTKNKLVKGWILLLSLVAFVGIYYTYVRTAMVMLLVGFIIQNFIGRGKSRVVKGLTVILLASSFLYIIYLNSPILQMRLNNTNAVGGQSLSEGSGRLVFWSTMIKLSFTHGPSTFLLGIGREGSMDYMKTQIGKRLFAHNGFLDILVSAGFIGLLLFFIFQKNLFKRVFKRSNINLLPSYRLVLVSFLMYWIAILFQSHQFFWVLIVLSFFVAQLEKEHKILGVYEIDDKHS